MNEEIAYLIGALRDGSFSEIPSQQIYRVRFYQKNRQWLEFISRIIEKNFGKKPGFYLDGRHNVWCLSLTSKKVFQELSRLAEFTGDQGSWLTPSWILNGAPVLRMAYVRGFFDAEGSVNSFEKTTLDFSEKNIRIYLAQANKPVLEELRKILLEFGVRCGRVCGPYFKKNSTTGMYALLVYGSKEVLKFYDCFNSTHPDKVFRFELLKSTRRGNKDSSVASSRIVWPLEGKNR
ncbi:TPA: hypothetical protein HA244_06575 [Candidatus Micrarchaeota archaeon]|nr:hypothetical protein [Candidatus Micrarchaeota archaeon]